MRGNRNFVYCFAGAIIASLSWGVIIFLYANVSSSTMNSSGRPLRFVPRHTFTDQLSIDSSLPHQSLIDIDRDENRPGHGRVQNLHRNEETQGEVIEGRYTNPFEASKITSDSDQHEYDIGKKSHAFNEFLSKRLSFHRNIKDTRDSRCSGISEYDSRSLKSVSIVMCFYNEALSVLLRSLHSIWDRTDHTLIQQIILVDDDSSNVELKGTLKKYVTRTFGKVVTIIRNSKREGLIRSRMVGARAASAEVLVFLDSHIEVNVGWLEPLVSRLGTTTVVLPIIDIIDPDTFEYKSSPLVRGGFTWSMRFSWEEIPAADIQKDFQHIRSPTMAGGLFAMNRNDFFDLGGYDEGMDIWGGENIEMSFRIWMCGGKIEIAVCSKVGHIFRRVRPYSSPTGEDTMTKNTLRLVNVWLGNYKDKYHSTMGNRYVAKPYGDVSDRIALRNRMNCHNFEWYLKNIYNPDTRLMPDKDAPQQVNAANKRSSSINIISKGKIKVKGAELCIQPDPSAMIGSITLLVLASCSAADQKWYELEDGGFLIDKHKCLDVVSSTPTITKCTGQGGTQQWIVQEQQGDYALIFSPGTGLCLSVHEQSIGSQVMLAPCKGGSLFKYVVKGKMV